MKITKIMRVAFYHTLRFQIEVLPRVSILYGKYNSTHGILVEWLWFGVVLIIKDEFNLKLKN
jgi:hypothetical protein